MSPEGIGVRCRRCLLTERHPGVHLDGQGICSVCAAFKRASFVASAYFQSIDRFRELADKSREKARGDYDVMLLFSGGKDSSYVLHRLAAMNLRILAFTFDNGYISAGAMKNIKRQTDRLGVESIVSETARMDEIFVDSLDQEHTVCHGCFKALTTISTRIAHEKGIPLVVTGLSRGQIFDTKISKLIEEGVQEVTEIDAQLRVFRRAYHANRDRTARLLDDSLADVDWAHMEFVDFFRYDNTPTMGIRSFLEQVDTFWSEPSDTGFCSSNCLMNDIGICVHTQERGFHNYEAPLSWDVRLGILSREDALKEVTPVRDVSRVNKVLSRIGYFDQGIKDVAVLDHHSESGHSSLCAYYVAPKVYEVRALRAHLKEVLPDYMIPARYVRVDAIPLTENGKVDYARLLPSLERPDLGASLQRARTQTEGILVEVWRRVLKLNEVGIDDNFFELGGDSIVGIQIAQSASERGVRVEPREVFLHQTIAGLAAVAKVESGPVPLSDEGTEEGEISLTPIQRWFFSLPLKNVHCWAQSIVVSLPRSISHKLATQALEFLVEQCDSFRVRYFKKGERWSGAISGYAESSLRFSVSSLRDERKVREQALESLNISSGPLLVAVYVESESGESDRKASRPRLFIAAHHLAIDALSWSVLLAGFEDYCLRGLAEAMPVGFSGYRSFSRYAKRLRLEEEKWVSENSEKCPVSLPAVEGLRFDSGRVKNESRQSRDTNVVTSELNYEELQISNDAGSQSSLRNLILAAVARAIMQVTKEPQAYLIIESHGRDALSDSDRVVGWLTDRMPFIVENGVDLETVARSVGKRFSDMIQTVDGGRAPFGFDGLPMADVCFNFLGRSDMVLPVGSTLGLAERLRFERPRSEVRGNPIEVDVMTENRSLRITWDFDCSCVERQTVSRLAALTERELRTYGQLQKGRENRAAATDFTSLSKALQIVNRDNRGGNSDDGEAH